MNEPSRLGPLKAMWNLEQTIVDIYREWMPTYLSEIERQEGLPLRYLTRCKSADCYHGGIDPESWASETCPEVIVTVAPVSAPETQHDSYSQEYNVSVYTITIGQTQEQTREFASYWAAATLLLVQRNIAGIRGMAERTTLLKAPELQWIDDETRREMRSVTEFSVFVTDIVERVAGPSGETIAESPEFEPEGPEQAPKGYPLIEHVHLTVEGEPI